MGTTQLVKKAIKAVKEEGIQGCAKKTKSYLENQKRLRRKIEKKIQGHIIYKWLRRRFATSMALSRKASERTIGSIQLFHRRGIFYTIRY